MKHSCIRCLTWEEAGWWICRKSLNHSKILKTCLKSNFATLRTRMKTNFKVSQTKLFLLFLLIILNLGKKKSWGGLWLVRHKHSKIHNHESWEQPTYCLEIPPASPYWPIRQHLAWTPHPVRLFLLGSQLTYFDTATSLLQKITSGLKLGKSWHH